MKQRNSEELLIEIGKLAIKIDEAEDDYQMEVAEYKYRLREHEACGTGKPSTEYLKCTEESLSLLHRRLSSLIKEFRAIWRCLRLARSASHPRNGNSGLQLDDYQYRKTQVFSANFFG